MNSLFLVYSRWHILLLLWDTPLPARLTTMSLMLHLMDFPQQHSPPQPYWTTVVSKTCHDLFHFISVYDCFSLFLVYLSLPCPPGKSSISPMQMYLVYEVFPELSKQTTTCPSMLPETSMHGTLTLLTLHCIYEPLPEFLSRCSNTC